MSSRESKSGSDGGSEDENVLDGSNIGGFNTDTRNSNSAISPSLDPLLNNPGNVEIENILRGCVIVMCKKRGTTTKEIKKSTIFDQRYR